MVCSRNQKDYQLNQELHNYRDVRSEFSRKSLMKKLDRKLESIRISHVNDNYLKSTTASLWRLHISNPYQPPPKRYLMSESADEEKVLLFSGKRGTIKEDIAKSIGKLSSVSHKLY
jgi:hypothetical protein